MTHPKAVAAVLLLVACGADGTSVEPSLVVPQDVEIGWDASFNQRAEDSLLLLPR